MLYANLGAASQSVNRPFGVASCVMLENLNTVGYSSNCGDVCRFVTVRELGYLVHSVFTVTITFLPKGARRPGYRPTFVAAFATDGRSGISYRTAFDTTSTNMDCIGRHKDGLRGARGRSPGREATMSNRRMSCGPGAPGSKLVQMEVSQDDHGCATHMTSGPRVITHASTITPPCPVPARREATRLLIFPVHLSHAITKASRCRLCNRTLIKSDRSL